MREPVRVAVTGAAGAISYTILFKIAAGALLGKDQPMILQLVEIPPAMKALDGVVMELVDCAFPYPGYESVPLPRFLRHIQDMS